MLAHKFPVIVAAVSSCGCKSENSCDDSGGVVGDDGSGDDVDGDGAKHVG